MNWMLVVAIGLLVSFGAAAGWAQPMQPAGTPSVHRSACELGQSMAGKLGGQAMTAERAQQTCQLLMPTMHEADAAEFKRCCAAKLQAGPAQTTR